MTIKDFAENVFFKALPDLKTLTTLGFINKTKEKTIGIYERKSQPINTYGKPSYSVKNLTILVHWTKGSTSCEEKAQEIARVLNRYKFDNGWVVVDAPPVDVGKDENEIFERTLDLTIYIKEE